MIPHQGRLLPSIWGRTVSKVDRCRLHLRLPLVTSNERDPQPLGISYSKHSCCGSLFVSSPHNYLVSPVSWLVLFLEDILRRVTHYTLLALRRIDTSRQILSIFSSLLFSSSFFSFIPLSSKTNDTCLGKHSPRVTLPVLPHDQTPWTCISDTSREALCLYRVGAGIE